MRRALGIGFTCWMLFVGMAVETVWGQAGPSIAGCPIFSSNNVWNTRIQHLPVDSNSSAYINSIGAGTGVHPDFGSGAWNGGPIGIPYNIVSGTQPKVRMEFGYEDESDPGPYPIPPDAEIEGGYGSDGDRHILVIDKDNCVLYETWSTYPNQDGSWYAGSGAIFNLLSHDLRPEGWTSADAAGLPILPGLVRYDEVAAGEIRHAIRFTAPKTRKAYVWPGRHYASNYTTVNYPPMAQRFRLKANFDISGFSPEIQVILRAMKEYGIILADNGSAWYIQGVPDPRWDNDMLVGELKLVKGSDFEAVNVASLMVDPDSGQARQDASDTEPPTIPGNLIAAAVSSSQINLSWTASIDNVQVMNYCVYRCQGSGCSPSVEIGTSGTTSYQDSGLRSSTVYGYRTAAIDAAGNVSDKSTSAFNTTQPIPSTAFTIGDRVRTARTTQVRATPSTSGKLSGTQPRLAFGTVVGGPWRANSSWWWQVDFDIGIDGWAKQGYLKK